MNWIKPRALRQGDGIGVVAPASSVNKEPLDAGCRELERLGFNVHYRDDIYSEKRYLAGSDQRRLAEFHEMLRDKDISAIICARGGYGSGHLLDGLSISEIRANPKILCGSSDITMLLSAYGIARVVSFHGPMVASNFDKGEGGYDTDIFQRLLVEGEVLSFPTTGTEILCHGEAEGRLAGGCLSLLVSTLGTKWELDTSNTILLLEDINVKPYQIDRMLTHLKQAGKFDSVQGVVFGEMPGCSQDPNQGYSLAELLREHFDESGVPVLSGFPTGHSSKPHLTVPLGVNGRLTLGQNAEFKMMECAVALS